MTDTVASRLGERDAGHDASTAPEATDAGSSLGALLAPVRARLAGACVLQAAAAVGGLVPYIAVAELASELLVDGPVDRDRVWAITWVAVVALVAGLGLSFAAGGITHFADNDLQLDLRRRLAERLGRVPLGWFGDHSSGEVKRAVADDVAAMHHLVGHTFTDMVAAVVGPVVAIGYLLTVDWQFTLVALVPVVIGFALYAKQMSGYSDKMATYNESLQAVNSAAVEFVQGIAVVKTFGQTGRAHRRFVDAADGFVDHFWNWVRGMLRLGAASDVVLSPMTGLVTIAAAGAWFVGNDWIAPIDVLPFFLVGLAIAAPILSLGYAASDLQLASQAAHRVAALLDTATLTEPANPKVPAGTEVRFESVRFRYDDTREVLAGIDLTLTPGTVTALVGPSGAGKSTIAKLLCRFWDPTDGRITLGGVDLRDVATDELFRSVGFVFQDVQLLRTSVVGNIALARPDASPSQIEHAARSAQIHDRIAALPRGYDSVIGDDAMLSGGEAQRVSIARALLADTPILVLDEATAFADPESEAAIQDALSLLIEGRTLLVVAHRLSTITEADQIVVVDDGRIVEVGAHTQLVERRDGRYRRMWDAHERTRHDLPTGGTT